MFIKELKFKNYVKSKKDAYILKYYLTTNRTADQTMYGIKIEKYLLIKDKEIFESSETQEQISNSYTETDNLITKLSKSTIAPKEFSKIFDEQVRMSEANSYGERSLLANFESLHMS